MAYDPTWPQGDAAGRVVAAEHAVDLPDAEALVAAVNRRRRLTYQAVQDFSSHVAAGLAVRAATLATATAPPLDNLRDNLAQRVLAAPTGTLGGSPASPVSMDWLWPVADGDAGKVIVATDPDAGEVGLFDKLNATGDWTDPVAGATPVRDVHCNELRRVVEWLRRGRWSLPVYLAAGLYSPLPDTPWLGDLVAHNDAGDELRSVGFALLRSPDAPQLGLADVTVLDATALELVADADCTVAVYRCKRDLDFDDDPPSWNEYDPSAGAAWDAAGGTGADDAAWIGSVALTADVPDTLTGSALATACQAMIPDDPYAQAAPASFLLRRVDTGGETVLITATLHVEFELNAPPN
ncbi:MAG: hypothetical protein ACOC8F_03790 [Planctomycetota bacterium]